MEDLERDLLQLQLSADELAECYQSLRARSELTTTILDAFERMTPEEFLDYATSIARNEALDRPNSLFAAFYQQLTAKE